MHLCVCVWLCVCVCACVSVSGVVCVSALGVCHGVFVISDTLGSVIPRRQRVCTVRGASACVHVRQCGGLAGFVACMTDRRQGARSDANVPMHDGQRWFAASCRLTAAEAVWMLGIWLSGCPTWSCAACKRD